MVKRLLESPGSTGGPPGAAPIGEGSFLPAPLMLALMDSPSILVLAPSAKLASPRIELIACILRAIELMAVIAVMAPALTPPGLMLVSILVFTPLLLSLLTLFDIIESSRIIYGSFYSIYLFSLIFIYFTVIILKNDNCTINP